MDITEGSPQRKALGIDLFTLHKESLTYAGVNFSLNQSGNLSVSSFSEHLQIENTDQSEAIEKISRSKMVMEELKQTYPTFAAAISLFPTRYEFCLDYGSGAVLVASEVEGVFEWHS